jgi:uncharacterized membrane protein YfcA
MYIMANSGITFASRAWAIIRDGNVDLLLSLLLLIPGLVVLVLSFAIAGDNNRIAWIVPTLIISSIFLMATTALERSRPSITEELSAPLLLQAMISLGYPVALGVGAWWFRRYRESTRAHRRSSESR